MLSFLKNLLDFFIPKICFGCESILHNNEKIVCLECKKKLTYADKVLLAREFRRKFSGMNVIQDFTSLFVFIKNKEIQNIVHALKYQGHYSIGNYFGELIFERKKNILESWKIDIIHPIPLHRIKKAERGYNQSYYIAEGLSKKMNVPVSEKLTKRAKYTETQTKMNLLQRKDNIRNAFIEGNQNVNGKNILLVDDLITTGSTIEECGKVLLKSGANKIYAISVALAE